MTPNLSHPPSPAPSRLAVNLGRGISVLVILFMVFDGAMKVAVERHVVSGMAELGWPSSQTVGLGLVILACTALYAWPRSSVLGAILLTGFLGGATAAKARLGDPFPAFSVAMGVLTWLGLYLRDARIRALLPLRRAKAPIAPGAPKLDGAEPQHGATGAALFLEM